MSFCQNCGKELVEESTFCPYCGYMIHTADGSYSDGANANPYNSNPYGMSGIQAPPPQGKRKVPGRGFGISSLVLGIVGLYYAFYTFLVSFYYSSLPVDFYALFESSSSSERLNMDANELIDWAVSAVKITSASIAFILCILSLTFAICAFSKKYKNGVSVTGFILSCIGIVGGVVALIV